MARTRVMSEIDCRTFRLHISKDPCISNRELFQVASIKYHGDRAVGVGSIRHEFGIKPHCKTVDQVHYHDACRKYGLIPVTTLERGWRWVNETGISNKDLIMRLLTEFPWLTDEELTSAVKERGNHIVSSTAPATIARKALGIDLAKKTVNETKYLDCCVDNKLEPGCLPGNEAFPETGWFLVADTKNPNIRMLVAHSMEPMEKKEEPHDALQDAIKALHALMRGYDLRKITLTLDGAEIERVVVVTDKMKL